MENKEPNLFFLFERFKERIRIKLDLLNLKIAESTANTLAHILSRGVLILIIVILVIFGSIALSFYLGNLVHNLWLGFLCVSGIYLLIGFFLYLIKDGYIKKYLIDVFVRTMLKNKDHEQTE